MQQFAKKINQSCRNPDSRNETSEILSSATRVEIFGPGLEPTEWKKWIINHPSLSHNSSPRLRRFGSRRISIERTNGSRLARFNLWVSQIELEATKHFFLRMAIANRTGPDCPELPHFLQASMANKILKPYGGCMAKRKKHTCFSPISPRFDSQHSQKNFERKIFWMLLRLINVAGWIKVDSGLKILIWRI